MKAYLDKLPKEIQDLIFVAGDIAAKNNMPAYLVGGFVRDLLLGVENLDLDIVVEGDGINFAEGLAESLGARLIRHKRFGTATVLIKPQAKKIDIATARCESYPTPASLPVVTASSLKDDLRRRDFTINAMAISINQHNFGQLIDFFDARVDLRQKKIRVLHRLSFIDDPTRILRAIRFEKRHGFNIEANTLLLLKEAVRRKMLEKVQPQRLRDELILVLKEAHPLKQIMRMRNLTGFSFINPHLLATKKTYNLIRAIHRQIEWFKKSFPGRRALDVWLIYFMGLIDSLATSDVKLICQKFVFRQGEEKRILVYKKLKRLFFTELGKKKIKPAIIFNLLEPLSYEVIILIKAKYKNPDIRKHIEDFFEIYNGMRILITGKDLHRLGLVPGPAYRKIFAQVLKAKLGGAVKTKEEELALIKKIINSQ